MADDDRFYVKTLTLENFRCFERLELTDLDPHFNLLIGENGAGKTSILLALANLFRPLAARGGILASDRILNKFDVRNGAPKDRLLPGSTLEYAAWTMTTAFKWYADELQVREDYTLLPSLSSGSISRVGSDRRVTDIGGGFSNEILSLRHELLAHYSVDRRFIRPANANQQDESTDPTHPAYRNWLTAGASATYLREWFRDLTLRALQSERRANQDHRPAETALAFVAEAVTAANPDATKIEYDGELLDIVVYDSIGKTHPFASMSAGQKALTGLVVDIAYRAFSLNGELYGARTLKETTGLVLIDEIDLHLHPKWQRQIVGALKNIFPKIQFFATTHSPQVIGEARPEEIVLLTKDGKQKRPASSFGMDSNWVLECVMDAEGRDPEIAKRVRSVFNAIDDDQFEAARAEIARLRKDIGEAPDILGAEAYMWRIEHEADEAAE